MLSACRNGHLDIATVLLKGGAGVNDVTTVRFMSTMPICYQCLKFDVHVPSDTEVAYLPSDTEVAYVPSDTEVAQHMC